MRVGNIISNRLQYMTKSFVVLVNDCDKQGYDSHGGMRMLLSMALVTDT